MARLTPVLGGVLLSIALVQPAAATKIYSVQVGAYPTSAEAQPKLAEASMIGSPAFMEAVDDGTTYPVKVRIGHFPSYCEAWVYKSKLLSMNVAPDCFIVSAERALSTIQSTTIASVMPFNSDGAADTDPADATSYWQCAGITPPGAQVTVSGAGTLVSSDSTANLATVSGASADLTYTDQTMLYLADDPAVSMDSSLGMNSSLTLDSASAANFLSYSYSSTAYLSRDQLLAVGKTAPRDPAHGSPALENFLVRYPADPQKNVAKLHLARAKGRGIDFARAEQLLTEVRDSGTTPEKTMARFLHAYVKYYRKSLPEAFSGFCAIASNKAAPPSLRRESMRRAAGVAHRMRNYPDAWLAFRQLERSAREPVTAAEARMQLAGLAYELVQSGKGSWSEFRGLSNSVQEIVGASRQTLATARLMHLESYFYDHMYYDALNETEGFLRDFQDVPREYQMAKVWQGIVLNVLGQNDRAKQVLQEVITAGDPSAKFSGVEPRARAAAWLAWIADKTGDVQLRDQNRAMLQSQFPDSEENKHLMSLFGAVPQ